MMTFGLRNAGQFCQRYIFKALGDLDFVFAYIDDILISSTNLEEHREHLRIVFQRLKNVRLRLNFSKCQFGRSELEFLGYTINDVGSEVFSISTGDTYLMQPVLRPLGTNFYTTLVRTTNAKSFGIQKLKRHMIKSKMI